MKKSGVPRYFGKNKIEKNGILEKIGVTQKIQKITISGSQPPGVAASQKAAVEVLMDEPEHVMNLWKNTNYFRTELQSIGFDTGLSETPIIPVMCGESKVAKDLSSMLSRSGILVGAIVFPMVSRDKARVRTQMSSGLTRDDLDKVLSEFERCGKKLGLI